MQLNEVRHEEQNEIQEKASRAIQVTRGWLLVHAVRIARGRGQSANGHEENKGEPGETKSRLGKQRLKSEASEAEFY